MKGKTWENNRSCVDKEGREAAIYHSIRKVNCGDVLCVQLHTSSWWPAQVVDDCTVSASKKPGKRRADEVLVRLYGCYEYLYVDPLKFCLEFQNTLKEYDGSHSGILKKTLKEDLHQLKFDILQKEDLKMKGKDGADSSQDRKVKQKQNLINKSQNMKLHSSVRPSSKELNAKSPNEKSQERSLGAVSPKNIGSRKRKIEDTHKKSNSNSIKSAIQERKHKKDQKVEPKNKSSSRVLWKQLSSEITSAKSRKQEQEHKKLKANDIVIALASPRRPLTGTSSKNSVKRSKTSLDKSEQGKKKEQEKNNTSKNSRPNSPNPAKAKHGNSSSERIGSSRSEGQTQNAVRKRSRPSSSHSSKISRTNKDNGQKKNPKASKHRTVSTIMVEEDKEPSGRRLKIMRTLGLIAPAGSQFSRNGQMSPTSVLLN